MNTAGEKRSLGPSKTGDGGTNTGFSVGGGVEGSVFSPNWTWKFEYLYLDLGSVNSTGSFALGTPFVNLTNLTGTITTHTHFIDNIVRVGLNYHFGGPVVARY